MRRRLALAVMIVSGFASLAYQIIWTQQYASWLGHETAAVLAVIGAFFGGLAVGALVFASRIERSAHAVRWYAACELVIGCWSLILGALLERVGGVLLDITGAQPTVTWQWAVAFGGTFVVLLPATAAMGATLPAMERMTASQRPGARSIAALYAANTFGAVFGVLAAAFWLVPALGLSRTAGLCAVLNLLCAATAMTAFRETPVTIEAPACSKTRQVLPMLAVSGLLGIGYEVLVVRVLSQVAEDTVYTFAMLLAIYLVGSALGAAAYPRWLRSARDPDRLRDRLIAGLATACLLGTLSLFAADDVKALVVRVLGSGMPAALGAEAAIALIAFGLPTFMMGALFCHLCAQARAAGIGFGRALGVNTLGAAAAPPLFGVLLVPTLGPMLSLLLVAAGYLMLSSRRVWPTVAFIGPIGAVLALALLAPPLAFVDVPEGGRIVGYHEGSMAAVSVVEDAGGVARLRIDNRQQEGSSATLLADARQAWLPLLLHPAPRRVLFLGLGTGMTASSAAEDPSLQVDAVELLPEVIAASAYFTDSLFGGEGPSRLHRMAADARRYVRASDRQYDVIVSDNFHPARSGSGSLYTVEHFRAVRDRLAAGGLFCQWLPLHQLDLETLRSIVQAFVAVYPDGSAVLATNSLETPVLGLVANAGAKRFDMRRVRERLERSALPQRLADYGIADELALMGSFVAGPRALRQFAGDAPANTDDRPIVAYRAPRIAYAPDSLPRERLLALLQQLAIDPAELVDAAPDPAWSSRLAAYWSARNEFLGVGLRVQPSADVRRMLSQVREPLLGVLRISPDFRPAYDPLLRMATVLARTDEAAARSLLGELVRAQPERSEAAQLLRRLPGA